MPETLVAYAVSALAAEAGASALVAGIAGAAAAGLVASALAPTQKVQGPRLGDLSVTGSAYGAVIPYVEGHPRIGGQIIWATRKKEIATTRRSGGKGGGGVKSTTYTYEIDLLILLTSCEIAGVLRVWSGGDLVFNQSTSATGGTLSASLESTAWDRFTVYGGDAAQLPDPDYEAAVGTDNAPAYRTRGTVFIKGLKLGQSGQLPNLTFEVVRDADVVEFDNFFKNDIGGDQGLKPLSLLSSYITTTRKFGPTALAIALTDRLSGGDTQESIDKQVRQNILGQEFVAEEWVYVPSLPAPGTFMTLVSIGGWHHLRLDSDGRIYPRPYDDYAFTAGGHSLFNQWNATGNVTKSPDETVTVGAWNHVVMYREGYEWWTICQGVAFHHRFEDGGATAAYFGQAGTDDGNDYWDLSDFAQMRSDNIYSNGSVYADLHLDEGGDTSYPMWLGFGMPAGAYGFYANRNSGSPATNTLLFDNFHLTKSVKYPSTSGLYVTPTNATVADDDSVTLHDFNDFSTLTAIDPTVAEVVNRLCLNAELDASQFDVTALEDIPTLVHGFAIGQVSTTRSVLEILQGCYFFGCVLYDKLYFQPRAGASEVLIPYEDLGYAEGGSAVELLPLTVGNELELPGQLAMTYNNIDGDWQTDTQYSPRVNPGQDSTEVIQVPMGFTASEAKVIVEANLLDRYVALLSSEIAVSLAYSKFVPTDPITVVGKDGSRYRFRILQRVDSGNVLKFSLVLDDATVFTQLGLTEGGTDAQTVVLAIPFTVLYLLDPPLLGDAFNQAGIYVAVQGERDDWTQASVYHSIDGVSYVLDTTLTNEVVAGPCTVALTDWSGGCVFDERSAVTVSVGRGELESVTRAQLLEDQGLNLAMIGSEVVQFRNAELISTGVYKLTGLLRGRRGTEWAMVGHAVGERFVLLTTTDVRFLGLSNADIGRARYYKGASAGERLSAVASQTITPRGVALKPFSPARITANRDTVDAVLEWLPRTRLATRFGGPVIQSAPMGEEVEAYEIDVYDDDTFTTVVRTLTSSTPTVTYTEAMEIDDYGSDSSLLYLRVYQMSQTVGRGYPLQAIL